MNKVTSISIFFSAYNEQDNIAKSVAKAQAILEKITRDYEIIIINDGSKDKTGIISDELAKKNSKIKVVHHNPNQGYGGAVISGLKASTKDYVFFTDADLQFNLDEITKLIEYLPEYEVVLGYRAIRKDPLMRTINAKLWNFLNRLLFGLKVRDIDCAFKIFKRSVIKDIDLKSRGAMVSAELLIRLQKNGVKWQEIAVTHLPRTAGSPTGAKPKVIFRAFRELFNIFFTTDLARKGFKEIFKFALVGAVSTIIDFAILNLVLKFTSVTIAWSVFWGFIGGSTNGYFMNNAWTFGHRNLPTSAKNMTKYIIISAIGLGITELIIKELAVKALYNVNASKLVAVFIVFFWNFFANRFWTFKATE